MSAIRLPEIEWECVLFVETKDGAELTIYSDCTASTKQDAEAWCDTLAKRMNMSLVGCEATVKGTSGHVPRSTPPAKSNVIALPAPAKATEVKPPEPFFEKAYFTANEDRPKLDSTKEALYD